EDALQQATGVGPWERACLARIGHGASYRDRCGRDGRTTLGSRRRRVSVPPRAQPERQRRRFGLCEIGQLDAPANVERRRAHVLDQIGGRSHAEEAERQAVPYLLFRTQVETLADGGEELVRRERQTAHRIDLVDEDDQGRFYRRERRG